MTRLPFNLEGLRPDRLLFALLDRPFRWFLVVAFASVVFGRLDLWVSGLFWSPDAGFFMTDWVWMQFVRKGLPPVLVGGMLFVIALWIAGKALQDRFLGVTGKAVSFLLATLVVGPGLIVNGVFKEFWGRARPSQIEAFGGDSTFSPPWMLADQCVSNCAFMSGHGSLGFWLVAPALLAPPEQRGFTVGMALVAGAMVGVVRIAQGGHFFWDVVWSGLVTVFLAVWLYRKLYGDPRKTEVP